MRRTKVEPMRTLERLGSEAAYLIGAGRALWRTTSIARHRDRTLRDLAEDLATRYSDRTALISQRETFTYAQWNGRANQYARWMRDRGYGKGDVIALLMPNRPEYLAVWLGFGKVGGVTALLNTNLPGAALAHCIRTVAARAVIVDASLVGLFDTACEMIPAGTDIYIHGEGPRAETADRPRIDLMLQGFSTTDIPAAEQPPLTIDDRCLYIYTSGTTGMPKAANLNHYRVQLAMRGFWGATGATSSDRMYVALPMYHTVGGVCATGSVLCAGGSVFIRDKFSATEFWAEIARENCTMFAYVGELCRYLLAAGPSPFDRAHRLRLIFGNGLRPDVWVPFRERFGIPRIIEFYAATEGNVTLFNFDSRPGAVGRLPKWMERRFVVKIVRFDLDTEMPVRGADGKCIECGPDEVGEALGKILNDPSKPAARFEGYADREATEKKILRDAFEPGDAWFRSGDLMRKDADGYFYFIDRVGDTFRWKGENVSTTEVAEVLTSFPGIHEAIVYGVEVPGHEGRAGMVALSVPDVEGFDLAAFRAHLAAHLPDYARPLFVRFQPHLDMTSTFKLRKVELVKEGFDPAAIADPIFVEEARSKTFVRLDAGRFRDICDGRLRV
jgi:fatty-acyl-CoA synthase